jgi:hypothetical protein
MPDLGNTLPAKVYLLLDAQSDNGAPELEVMINYKHVPTYPLPLYEFAAASKDIPTLINLQSRMMDVDQRTFRQWWVYPIDSNLLQVGKGIGIIIYPKYGNSVKFFGDYCSPRPDAAGGETWAVPNLASFSWSKGFLTADSRDPRVYDEVYFRGRAKGSVAMITDHSSDDLKGKLRLRLAVPMVGPKSLIERDSRVPINLMSMPDDRQISGQNPRVFDSLPVVLPLPLAPSSLLHLHVQMRRRDPAIPITMALSLDLESGTPAYSPVWQPSCLRVGKNWQDFDITTILPAETRTWKHLAAHLLLSPYPGDRLYMHRKEALKDSIFVRNLKIEILPPAVPGGGPGGALKLI